MGYRQATLDFQGIHLAVLTGENGAGKSSLLDAITWALWGKARARRDDELIHLGQSEMEVEYSFGLGDNIYRVIRKRDARKRGRSELSFQVEDAGGWRTLTEPSIRATQEKINRLMRLDYDTFINSAFLLQGRADEFTTKPPGKRKEILSDILGLGIYEMYETRAKERANRSERDIQALTAQIGQIEQELAKEPEYRQALVEARQEAAGLRAGLESAEKEMELLREQHRAITDKQRQLEDLRHRLQKTEADIADTTQAVAEARLKIEEYQAILGRRAQIEAGLEQLGQARAALDDWEQRLHESARLAEQKHQLDKALSAARAEVEARLRELDTRIELLSPQVDALESTRGRLLEAQAALEALQQVEQSREAARAELSDLDTEAARLEEQNRQLKTEMNDIKAKLTQLEQAGSKCPVCRRPLDETHQKEVLGQFKEEGTAKGDTFRANQSRLRAIVDRRKALQEIVAGADKQLRQLAAAQGQVARLTQSLDEAEKAAAELEKIRAGRAELQDRLDRQAYAVDVLAGLSKVEAELAALGYNREAHQQTREKVEELRHFETEHRILTDADHRITEEENRLARESARLARLQEQTEADRRQIAALEQETAGLPELSNRLNQARSRVDTLERDYRYARDNQIRIEQNLAHITAQAKKRGELEEKLEQARQVLGVYRELQLAFGKKGIQALLIESAIPEIEDEANRLLSRMTDSRMHVRFETQREAKSSDSTIETLDIRISDELGTRDYELYSGGEAFRVNFAIRVAMSKVLARRAGARLQTLVIDEGFGTQDGQGRERLVEAINAIQDDFEKILVITHIDELKEAFPVRIEIQKTVDGSQVAIR